MFRIVQCRYLGVGMLICMIFMASLGAVAQENVIETVGTKAAEVADGIGQGIEGIRNDLGKGIGDATGGVTESLAVINEVMKKLGAVISIAIVVVLGILARYIANLVFHIVVGLLILLGKPELARDMKAVIDGLIGLGIVVGSIIAFLVGSTEGIVGGTTAGINAQLATWIVTPVAALTIRIAFPQRYRFFSRIREVAK